LSVLHASPSVLTVGAPDCPASSGHLTGENQPYKPDLVAPASGLLVAAPSTALNPAPTRTASGTAYAAAQVAGTAALMLEARPGLPVDALAALLRGSATAASPAPTGATASASCRPRPPSPWHGPGRTRWSGSRRSPFLAPPCPCCSQGLPSWPSCAAAWTNHAVQGCLPTLRRQHLLGGRGLGLPCGVHLLPGLQGRTGRSVRQLLRPAGAAREADGAAALPQGPPNALTTRPPRRDPATVS
jgi:hypothetical protein